MSVLFQDQSRHEPYTAGEAEGGGDYWWHGQGPACAERQQPGLQACSALEASSLGRMPWWTSSSHARTAVGKAKAPRPGILLSGLGVLATTCE